ncbi:hypothetical protein QYE76_055360 [Lolium multiflorum]|uniref:Uncharacterized protein n=1 Tax=Lolium multiflorum TaxID=4521 RepID=A0AAD8SZK2_LOLMU|nr:hypothetical protein QYE76_055360 [Lolium multiflorum]
MASSSSISSWRVTYARRPLAGGNQNNPFLDGVLIVHHARERLLLLNRAELVVDSRSLREKESIVLGGPVALPRHDVRIPPKPLPPSSLFDMEVRPTPIGGESEPRNSSTTFPASIDELFYSKAPNRSPMQSNLAAPPRPRGGHAIDPGRWGFHGLLGASPSTMSQGSPGPSAGLGLGPGAADFMAAIDRDGHTCSDLPPSIVHGGHRQTGPSNPRAYIPPGGGAAHWSNLDLLLEHLWGDSRVCSSPPRSSHSFGWWRGKVAGDPRSFAQVAAAPPMGDGGGRFGGGRGRNQPNRGRGRNVWQCDEAPQTSSNNLRASNSHSQQSNDRWEVAAWDSEKRRQEASSTGGGCLGDNFYDFYYEVDKIVVGKLPGDATNVTVGYLVQSPDASLEDNMEETHTELDPRMNSRRASVDMNSNIMEKVENVARKRNLEGLQKMEDRECLVGDADKMVQAAASVYSRSRGPATTAGQGQLLMITGPPLYHHSLLSQDVLKCC